MILKECRRCGNMIAFPKTYCDKCQVIVDKEREEYRAKSTNEANRRYNATRDPKYIRFYNSPDWKILSAKYIMDRGYRCENCGAIASEVHHKVPIQTPEGWSRRLDYTNLECVCLQCHNDRHNRFKRKEKRRG